MVRDDPDAENRALWKRFRKAAAAAARSACPDANTMASYLEGRGSREEVESLETHLSLCSFCLENFIELRSLTREPAAGLPPKVLARAKGLVLPAFPSVRFRVREALSWAAVAATLVFVCRVGFELGRATAVGGARATSLVSSSFSSDVGIPVEPGGAALFSERGLP